MGILFSTNIDPYSCQDIKEKHDEFFHELKNGLLTKAYCQELFSYMIKIHEFAPFNFDAQQIAENSLIVIMRNIPSDMVTNDMLLTYAQRFHDFCCFKTTEQKKLITDDFIISLNMFSNPLKCDHYQLQYFPDQIFTLKFVSHVLYSLLRYPIHQIKFINAIPKHLITQPIIDVIKKTTDIDYKV